MVLFSMLLSANDGLFDATPEASFSNLNARFRHRVKQDKDKSSLSASR
jgi:hypothetical protein